MVIAIVLGLVGLFFLFCIRDYANKYIGYNPNASRGKFRAWWRGFVKRHIVDADPWEHEDHAATRYARDYVDWSKVPKGFDWVAVDGGRLANGDPICVWAYHVNDGDTLVSIEDKGNERWDTKTGDGGVRPCDDAIIGPLPPWRESLRKRPTNTRYTCGCGYKAGECCGVCNVCGNRVECKQEEY